MCKIPPPEVFDQLLTRLEKRIEALKGVKLNGYEVAIAEREVEHTYLLREKRYTSHIWHGLKTRSKALQESLGHW
jgi:hypothetical protein